MLEGARRLRRWLGQSRAEAPTSTAPAGAMDEETRRRLAFEKLDAAFRGTHAAIGQVMSEFSDAGTMGLLQERLVDALDTVARQMGDVSARYISRRLLGKQIGEADEFLVPSLQTRDTPALTTAHYQNEIRTWDIQAGERVLDVGSGGWPFKKATHLADMFVGETTHRFEALQRDERPFYVLDIHQMPFPDKAWDFTFCSHVLEHLDRPGDAIRELERVSRRGYIEVPTRLSDVMLNFTKIPNHHRWHGLVLGETLVLTEWTDAERRDLGTDFFYRALHTKYLNSFQSFFEQNWDFFFAMMPWTGKIRFLIIDQHGKIIDRSADDDRPASSG